MLSIIEAEGTAHVIVVRKASGKQSRILLLLLLLLERDEHKKGAGKAVSIDYASF